MNTKMRAILLVGHGAPASDSPPELIGRLKEMESRRRRNHLPPDQDERDLDRTLRDWPRTPENDPYKFGLDAIAKGLKTRLSGELLKVAFNEFCAPDISGVGGIGCRENNGSVRHDDSGRIPFRNRNS